MTGQTPLRPRRSRSSAVIALLLAAGCSRPAPQPPGTFTATMGGSARGEYKGQAEFCVSRGGGATLSFISRPDAAGFLLHAPALKPGVFRADDRADFDARKPERYVAQAYVPDSLIADPYVRTASVRIGRADSLHVEGNFALTLVPREDARAKRLERGLSFKVAFVARPRANCNQS